MSKRGWYVHYLQLFTDNISVCIYYLPTYQLIPKKYIYIKFNIN